MATVDQAGLITARGDGTTKITIQLGGISSTTVPVTVKEFTAGLPVNFANQVVPIFTKLGCNAGGCHGKASGQNGFRLSLLGFEPALDYETLVKEGRGRRVFPAAPEASLLLDQGHGQGSPRRRQDDSDPDSHEYRLIRRWIAIGMPMGKPTDPKVERISIYPGERVLARGTAQQVVVTATYTDGTTEDVTRWAQYQSNETDVAAVEQGGRVETRRLVRPGRDHGPLSGAGRRVPGHGSDRHGRRGQGRFPCPERDRRRRCSSSGKRSASFPRRFAATTSSSAGRRSTSTARLARRRWRSKRSSPTPRPEKRARLVDQPARTTRVCLVLRDQVGGHPPEQARRQGRYPIWRRSTSTTGFARAWRSNVPYDQFVAEILAASGTPESVAAGAVVSQAA